MLDQQVVLEIEGVQKWHAVDARLEPFDLFFGSLDVAEIVRLLQSQPFQLGLQRPELGTAAAR